MSEDKVKGDRRLAVMADYQRVFGTEHGRRVLRRMMKECGIFDPSYVPGDPQGTAFNEGKRSAVLDICNRLKVDLVKMEQHLTRQPDEDDYDNL